MVDQSSTTDIGRAIDRINQAHLSNEQQVESAMKRFTTESTKAHLSNERADGSPETTERVNRATEMQSDQFRRMMEEVPEALAWATKNLPVVPKSRNIEWIVEIAMNADDTALTEWDDERYERDSEDRNQEIESELAIMVEVNRAMLESCDHATFREWCITKFGGYKSFEHEMSDCCGEMKCTKCGIKRDDFGSGEYCGEEMGLWGDSGDRDGWFRDVRSDKWYDDRDCFFREAAHGDYHLAELELEWRKLNKMN